MLKRFYKIAVIGDGGWGTTLSIHLAQKGFSVWLWGAFPAHIAQVKKSRINKKFLPGIRIPSPVHLTDNLTEALNKARLVVLAVPSQYLTGVLQKLKTSGISGKVVLSVIKGIDFPSGLRMSQVIEKELGKVPVAVLSGPTIAMEVAHKIPTTAVIASRDEKVSKDLQRIFHTEHFRIYTNSDMIGVELGGSVKNIIAIASGICDGLGLGTNTKAAMLTRGLAEMTRLGVALGAKAQTFYGLTGLGDLMTTCMSAQSRNRFVGEELGRGKSIRQIIGSMDMVAEGVETVRGIYELSRRKNVPMPITQEVYRIIYQSKRPQKAMADLLARQTRPE